MSDDPSVMPVPAAGGHHDESAGGHQNEDVPWGGNPFESGEANGGLGIQAFLYGTVAFFFFVIGTGYWFVTYEAGGTVMLLLCGMLVGTIAAYFTFKRREHHPLSVPVPHRRRGDDAESLADQPGVTRVTHIEVAPAEEAAAWFPTGSLWPFVIGVAVLLFANGLLLGIWLWLPALAFVAFALVGFALQARHRS